MSITWTPMKIFLGSVLVAVSLGCAQRDVTVRPEDSRSQRGDRGLFVKANASQAQQFLWAQMHAEKITEIKKIFERGFGTAVLPPCAGVAAQDVQHPQEKIYQMQVCLEKRAGSSVTGSWVELYHVTPSTLEMRGRELELEILPQDASKSRWTKVKITTDTSLWAQKQWVREDKTIYVAHLSDHMRVTPENGGDDERIWYQTVQAEVAVGAGGKVVALNNIRSLFSEYDMKDVFQGGLLWNGSLELDATCLQPKGNIISQSIATDGTTISQAEVKFFGEKGFNDGISGLRASRFPCDQNILQFFAPIMAK